MAVTSVFKPAGLRTVTIAYVDRAEDEAYAASRGYEGVHDATLPSPFPGAALAANDAKLVGQAIGVQFVLEHITLPAEADAAAASVSPLLLVLRILHSGKGRPAQKPCDCRWQAIAPNPWLQPN